MKKVVLILSLIALFGCTVSFNFKSNKNLTRNYNYSQKNADFIIYYNVKRVGETKSVEIVLKNNRNYVMSNLKLRVRVRNISDKYFYINRLKSSNIKKLVLNIPSDVKYVNFEYEYSLEHDDSFINPAYRIDRREYIYKGNFELLIK
ncbi:hypothetical protein FHQ18_08675 [Deferribacter autotrophicus]|uniref:Lipoprotein n=1 Tax=Deferribacter autotrophicus TaxID=500465 RepID=A0A5A8F399_9BACT|nr:hypothetical protein [Deferribacter autotrophicus]KAA0257807.1 hypothetical protein FHQ18_08675 [Deferribacter autotrophicus]